MALSFVVPRAATRISSRKGGARRVLRAASPASTSGLSLDEIQEIDDAVDALVQESRSDERRSDEELQSSLRSLGLKWGCDQIVEPWNHGCFEGSAVSGRLKEVRRVSA